MKTYIVRTYGKPDSTVLQLLTERMPVLVGIKWTYGKGELLEVQTPLSQLVQGPLTIQMVRERLVHVSSWRNLTNQAIAQVEGILQNG